MADGFKFPSFSDFESVFRDPLGSRSTSPSAKLAPTQTTIASQKNPQSVSPSGNSLSDFESLIRDPLGLYESVSHSRNQSDEHFETGGETRKAHDELKQMLKALGALAPRMAERALFERDNIYTVQGISASGMEVMEVYPKSNFTDVVIRYCGGENIPVVIHVKSICNSVKVEHCTNVQVTCIKVMEAVTASNSQKLQLHVGGRHVVISLDCCNGVIVTASAESLKQPGVCTSKCSGIILQRAETHGELTMEKMLSAPVNFQCEPAVSVVTRWVPGQGVFKHRCKDASEVHEARVIIAPELHSVVCVKNLKKADLGMIPGLKYIAVWDYESASPDELTLVKGDVLVVVGKGQDEGWVRAELYSRATPSLPPSEGMPPSSAARHVQQGLVGGSWVEQGLVPATHLQPLVAASPMHLFSPVSRALPLLSPSKQPEGEALLSKKAQEPSTRSLLATFEEQAASEKEHIPEGLNSLPVGLDFDCFPAAAPVIVHVHQGSVAHKGGLLEGDRILSVSATNMLGVGTSSTSHVMASHGMPTHVIGFPSGQLSGVLKQTLYAARMGGGKMIVEVQRLGAVMLVELPTTVEASSLPCSPTKPEVKNTFSGDMHVKVYKVEGFKDEPGMLDITDLFVRCTVDKEVKKTRSVINTGGAAVFDEVLSFKKERNSSKMKVEVLESDTRAKDTETRVMRMVGSGLIDLTAQVLAGDLQDLQVAQPPPLAASPSPAACTPPSASAPPSLNAVAQPLGREQSHSKYVVDWDYEAHAADELTLLKGDVVVVIVGTTQDDGWVVAEVLSRASSPSPSPPPPHLQRGLVPLSYLRPLSSSVCVNPPVSSVSVNPPLSVSTQPAASAFTVQDKDGKVAGKVWLAFAGACAVMRCRVHKIDGFKDQAGVMDKADPYVKLIVGAKDNKEFKTRSKNNAGGAAIFEEIFEFHKPHDEHVIKVQVWDSDTLSDDMIGEAQVDLRTQSLCPNVEAAQPTGVDLYMGKDKNKVGTVYLSFSMLPPSQSTGGT